MNQIDWKPYMNRLIDAVEKSGALDDTWAEHFGTKRPNGKSEVKVVNELRQAVNEAKMCVSSNG